MTPPKRTLSLPGRRTRADAARRPRPLSWPRGSRPTRSWGESLQAEHLAVRQQTARLLETSELRFLPLGGLDPRDVPPALRRRQRLEVPQDLRAPGERGLEVLRKPCGQLEPRRPRSRAAVGGRTVDPGLLQPPGGLERGVALPIDVGPAAVRSPRRELLRVPPVVQALDEAVHPAEAQRLVARVLVLERGDA